MRTVLILGSTVGLYSRPGQARGVQVDLSPERIGLRYPVEVGLVGDVKSTLQPMLPMLHQKQRGDRACLSERFWRELTLKNRVRPCQLTLIEPDARLSPVPSRYQTGVSRAVPA